MTAWSCIELSFWIFCCKISDHTYMSVLLLTWTYTCKYISVPILMPVLYIIFVRGLVVCYPLKYTILPTKYHVHCTLILKNGEHGYEFRLSKGHNNLDITSGQPLVFRRSSLVLLLWGNSKYQCKLLCYMAGVVGHGITSQHECGAIVWQFAGLLHY